MRRRAPDAPRSSARCRHTLPEPRSTAGGPRGRRKRREHVSSPTPLGAPREEVTKRPYERTIGLDLDGVQAQLVEGGATRGRNLLHGRGVPGPDARVGGIDDDRFAALEI